jgi:stage II sporulation protein D
VTRLRHGAVTLMLLCLGLPAWAEAADGGGRDVSIALFSTRTLRGVTLTPLGAHAWTASCDRCARKPFTAALRLAGPVNLFAGGMLRISDDANGESRTASGLWHLRATSNGGGMDVVLTLPSERYVAAVLNAEAASGEPTESLKALAIVARTYALNGSHYAAPVGHLSAELCDSTQCQAMLPGPVDGRIEDAVRATTGETLWFSQRRAEVFFSQNCGGLTEDAGAVWPGLGGAPYLRSHADLYCMRRDKAAWHAEVGLTQFGEVIRAEGWHVPAKIVSVSVAERSQSHRVLRIVFTGANGETASLSASALRFGIGRALGWNRVRSDAYDVGVRNGALVFDGHGHGHGVGLCQAGAAEMASEGKTAREILAFYFAGTAVRVLPGDAGWVPSKAGMVTVRSTRTLSAEQTRSVERSWGEAQRRFPPRETIAPEVVFAPTTELFRQLTEQPGWVLASTGGKTIVLQPDAVLRANGHDASETLLHEMLHVLVEAEASAQTPLWLREGLVGVLAGEAVPDAAAMTTSDIDSALHSAASWTSSQRAHRAATARVKELIARYGFSTVRGWLVSGPPGGVY